MTVVLIGVVLATICISIVAAPPAHAPVAEEETGMPWEWIAIGAVLLLLAALWMPRKQPAGGGGEGGDAEAAWWATKKGREMIITLLLLFLTMAGLQYAGMKALIAGGFIFTIWMVYRHFYGGEEEKVVTTQKLADEIADEMDYRGVKLDSHRDVYGQFLPNLGLHLVQFSHPITLVYIKNVKTGERGGPLCSTLNEAIEKIYAKRELWMPLGEGKKEGVKTPQMGQINTEEGD